MSTFGKGSSTSSIFPCRRVILSDIPFTATISRAFSMIVDMSTPITCLAPAFTANLGNFVSLEKGGENEKYYMERIEVPQPTSRTILSLKRCLFCTMAFMYDLVLTSSFCEFVSAAQQRRGASGCWYTPTFLHGCLFAFSLACDPFPALHSIHTMVIVAIRIVSLGQVPVWGVHLLK